MSKMFVNTIDLVLSEHEPGNPVEILRETRAGEMFVDKYGRELTISAGDLDEFAANFEAGLAQQEVPIDIDHEKGKSAGWFKKMWTEIREFSFAGDDGPVVEQLKVLKALPDWNKLGRELVGEQIYRYLSAWLDLANKVVKSVSLCNFPAVKGLAAAELADGMVGSVRIREYLSAKMHAHFTGIADSWAASGMLSTEERKLLSGAIGAALDAFAENTGDVGERLIQVRGPDLDYYYSDGQPSSDADHQEAERSMTMPKSEEELRAELRAEMEAELAKQTEQEAEMRERIYKEERERILAEVERRNGFVEFAEQVCNPEQGAGLAEKPEDVVAFLMSLPAERVDEAKRMLSAKVVEFGEIGSSRDGQEATDNLPSWAAVLLRDWVGSGLDVAEFFEANKAELGEAEQYDLSEFKSE